jgi:hypothetical protein
MRSDVTIPGDTTPVSALVKVTPEAELPIWGTPRLDPEFVTEFYPTDRRRRTDNYTCYVGVIDDAAADESDVAPTVFDDSSLATRRSRTT